MVSIPTHLADIAYDVKSKADAVRFRLKCNCGCKSFLLYESVLNEKEKAELEHYAKELRKVIKPGRTYTVTKEEDGTVHHWQLCWPFNRKKEVFPPKTPEFDEVSVLKAKCADCEKESVLFDSRVHGYDAVV